MRQVARILVVDDEDLIREALEIALTDEGHEVRTAANGREALDVLEQRRPTVIVLDLMMPVMDGWDFRAEQLRRATIADVPVILVSGARDVRTSAEQLSAWLAIPKPFDLDVVLAAVARFGRD